MDCLFCKIVAKEIPSEIVMETDDLVAFKDIHPQAPIHILIVPKKHIPTTNDVTAEDDKVVGEAVRVAKDLAKKAGVADTGYRLVWNCNRAAGQTIYHIHLHLLGGRSFRWPPG